MKLNVFKISVGEVDALKAKLLEKGLTSTKTLSLDGWMGDFYFSEAPNPGAIPWVKTFAEYLPDGKYYNRSYFAVILLSKDGSCFALSFGKSHFYVRPHCDYEFGVELAKRIASERDIQQTSARRFQGRQKKDIRSFSAGTRLNVPPGDSVDFLQSAIIPSQVKTYGPSGKFGASALVTPPITPGQIGAFLTGIESELKTDERFKLPRTVLLTDQDEIARFDEKLLDELLAPVGSSEIATDTFDLFGVDFVFASTGSFSLRCGHYKAVDLDLLTMKQVKEYIADREIPRAKLLQLKVTHRPEDGPDYVQTIKEAVDFISDEDRVVLSGGKWLKFNQDYLEFLDESIRQIEVEPTESELLEIYEVEGDFNAKLGDLGYTVADKDFSILQTASSTAVEAWDLQRGNTVYAVKFGTAQKLNYVCDQAMNVLELIHNKANAGSIPNFDRYCLWLGYRATKMPKSLADSRSIILKQKVDAWARRCEELGVIPVLKISLKLSSEHDAGQVGE